MPTARVNGITMYYQEHGAGEPLLLINGLGADITLLAPIIAKFERSFRVVAFDNRGAGRTDKPDPPYTIELMAQDTAALMDVHAGIPGSRMEFLRGGHMFFLFTERRQFLDQAGRFLAG